MVMVIDIYHLVTTLDDMSAYLPKLTISQRRTPKDHLGEKMQGQKG